MNSFMSWVGGKKALRDAVLARFPPYYERYIEVFGGAGWVLFHKPSGNDFEVYNDFNSNLANLYRCVRQNPNKLKYKLRYVLNSREDFDYIALLHKRQILPKLRDYDRAAKFYQLVRYSYASGLDSFGSQPHSIWQDFPLIDKAAARLQKVVIENKDFEKLIRQYDRPVSFFYCDPPYFNTESYYKDVGFTRDDHIRLMRALTSAKRFILFSYNDCPEIREIWDKPGIQIEAISRISKMYNNNSGAYSNQGENIVHEAINLLLADNGNHYVYIVPKGTVNKSNKVETVILVRKASLPFTVEVIAKATGLSTIDEDGKKF